MSELMELTNKEKSLIGTFREIKYFSQSEFMIRYLDHYPYLIYNLIDNNIEFKEVYSDINDYVIYSYK
jgi:hypothetical protein